MKKQCKLMKKTKLNKNKLIRMHNLELAKLLKNTLDFENE